MVFGGFPWFGTSSAQRAISAVEEKRQQRFCEVRKMVTAQDQQKRDAILALSFFELKDDLQNDKLTAVKVLHAYAWKAMQVQEQFNCICEFIIESFDEAAALDAKYGGMMDKPLLFGLPFSVKNNFFIRGYDSCIGLATWLGKPSENDCTFITQLRSLGAVPFVQTNVPQTLMAWSCSNPVYGTTKNPHNVERTSGGSSGGDASLLAAGGTAFATGGDIGGSLRIPAAFCGVVSLKPTQSRFLIRNAHSGCPGQGRLGLGTGVFTRTVDEQIFLVEALYRNAEYYRTMVPKSVPLPLNLEKVAEVSSGKKSLRIGYFCDDGFISATPGCARVVASTVELLRGAGHEMITFRVPDPHQAVALTFKAIMNRSYALNLLSNNPIDALIRTSYYQLKAPLAIRWILSYLIAPFSPQLSTLFYAYINTPEGVWENNASIDDYVEKLTNYWLNELHLDAVVCPAFPVPAPPHRYPALIAPACFATALWNLCDFSAGVVPTGRVTAEDDAALVDEEHWPTGSNLLLKQVRAAAVDSKGLPLAVQVVTLPFEEETCLGVMRLIEQLWVQKKRMKAENRKEV